MTSLTTSGLNSILSSVLDSFDNMLYMAFGNGTTAFDVSQTTLSNELLRVPVSITPIKNTSDGTYIFQGRIPLGSALVGLDLSEVGIFDSSSGGTMGLRELLSTPYTVGVDEEIVIRLRVTTAVSNVAEEEA